MSKQSHISDVDISALKQFYQVSSNRALIAAMLHHIDKLQDTRRDQLQTSIEAVRQMRA